MIAVKSLQVASWIRLTEVTDAQWTRMEPWVPEEEMKATPAPFSGSSE